MEDHFNPTMVHTYTIEQLFRFIQNDEVTFQELKELGLHYQKQENLNNLIGSIANTTREEKEDFENACQMAATSENVRNRNAAKGYYQKYLDKWEPVQYHPAPSHITFCKQELDRLATTIGLDDKNLKSNLLEDMKLHTWRYSPYLMKLIMGRVTPDPSELEGDTSPAGQFLASGQTLKDEDLIQGGVLPEGDIALLNSIYENVQEVPQLDLGTLGEFPKDRTDVYMMGVKGSGKTCALAGIISELYNSGEVTYKPQLNQNGIDNCQDYYYALIEGVRHKKAFAPTNFDTISFMKLDIGPKHNKPLTFVEMSGEAFKNLASAHSNARDVWREMGANSCLSNTNQKVLCFFIDYQRVISTDGADNLDQDTVLSKALTVLSNDGPDPKKPEKGCTMSRVKTVAIVVTKSDLMGKDLSYEERENIAMEYVTAHLANFISNLKLLCRKHDINHPAKNDIYIFPYSLGDFYVGQSVQFKRDDSNRFIQFLKDTTDSGRNTILNFFRL